MGQSLKSLISHGSQTSHTNYTVRAIGKCCWSLWYKPSSFQQEDKQRKNVKLMNLVLSTKVEVDAVDYVSTEMKYIVVILE